MMSGISNKAKSEIAVKMQEAREAGMMMACDMAALLHRSTQGVVSALRRVVSAPDVRILQTGGSRSFNFYSGSAFERLKKYYAGKEERKTLYAENKSPDEYEGLKISVTNAAGITRVGISRGWVSDLHALRRLELADGKMTIYANDAKIKIAPNAKLSKYDFDEKDGAKPSRHMTAEERYFSIFAKHGE